MITYQTANITPELATEWLKKNRRNRPVNSAHVKRLARDMMTGRWVLSPQPIVFDIDGDLIDGQHRLHAVAESGTTAAFVVARGAARDSIRAIDMGVARQATGILTMLHGQTPSARAMSISNAMMTGAVRNPSYPTRQEQAEFYLTHRSAIEFALGLLPDNAKHARRAAVGAVIARAYYTVQRDVIAKFCMALTTGVTTHERDSNAIIARDWLMTFAGGTGANANGTVYRKVARALDAYRRDESIRRLYETSSEPFPIPEIEAA